MARATFLLPAAERFGGQRLSATTAVALGRADRPPATQAGRRAQLLRHYSLPPGTWPIAALSRQADAGDAGTDAWLRADPVYMRPDINGVRLMAHGESMGMTRTDSEALLPALKPLFGDAGFALDAPAPSRWYLRMARETRIPAFADPGDALGDDVFEHADLGPDGSRWRVLQSEAQIVLHNHPWNAARAAQGKPPINSLWFWGAGTLPDARMRAHDAHPTACTGDPTLHALASAAGGAQRLPARYPGAAGDALFDLAAMRDLARLDADWLQPALDALRRGDIERLQLDCEDGRRFALERAHRWRFWRRPLQRLSE
ncbi:phosphoglycerate mutase [Luteimonas sp. SX5]|uniref:Phosphoglycerate mutase n=1 Tax=Luteimonas galliterrae TaxID=2940486 RepID=A0ABT0MHF9_9GAMM|nr:phosphoglycerate mutase [Luteimonas galliterrae]MCL1633679.1 phosphoglycerate mutase [Luteimonas galliterrae]